MSFLSVDITRHHKSNKGHLAVQILTGKGPLGQLQLELSLPSWAVDLLVLGIVGYSVVGGLNPKSPTFSEENQRDIRKRGPGLLLVRAIMYIIRFLCWSAGILSICIGSYTFHMLVCRRSQYV